MKNKGIVVFSIVLLLAAIALLIWILFLGLNGKFSFRWSWGHKADKLIFSEQYQLADVNYLNIKQDAGDVIIENIDEDIIKVEVYGEKSENAEVSFNNNELFIKYKSTGNWFNRVYGDIKIYMPSKYSNNIKVENDTGKIKMQNFENATLDLNCDTGNVEVDRAKIINAKCDTGNIRIGTILNKCNIDCDTGNIEINSIEITENSNLKTDTGNIKVHNINDIRVEGRVDTGNCNIGNNNRQSNIILNAKSDTGNIKIAY